MPIEVYEEKVDSVQFILTKIRRMYLATVLAVIAVVSSLCISYALYVDKLIEEGHVLTKEDPQDIENWSGTHLCKTRRVVYPESREQLSEFINVANLRLVGFRPSGSHLSPNGLSFRTTGMISMQLLDKVLEIDVEKKQIKVEAGARIEQVAEALRPYGLTLANYASIKDQTVGGLIQVGGHGTGARIPPIDEMVVRMEMFYPINKGRLDPVAATISPELFEFSKVALGTLGIMYSATLQCIDAHKLYQRTFTTKRSDLRRNHARWIQDNQYVRYMWIPYTDSVVVEISNRTNLQKPNLGYFGRQYSESEQLKSLRNLLTKNNLDLSQEKINQMSAFEIRDQLVRLDPLDCQWIKQVNQAELEYWSKQNDKVDWQDKLLAFDCGGQQLVLEAAIPCGTLQNPDLNDLTFIEELLYKIEYEQIPAPSPIEQRFSSRSTSVMSPCYSTDPNALFSWIGIIMYLPTDNKKLRKEITNRFRDYSRIMDQYLIPKYNGVWHWAKIEIPHSLSDLEFIQGYLLKKYPVKTFNAYRERMDPYGILCNGTVDILMPKKRK